MILSRSVHSLSLGTTRKIQGPREIASLLLIIAQIVFDNFVGFLSFRNVHTYLRGFREMGHKFLKFLGFLVFLGFVFLVQKPIEAEIINY